MRRLPLLAAVLAFSICVHKYGSRGQPIYGCRTYAQMINYARHLRSERRKVEPDFGRWKDVVDAG